jgi:hypothetical protein
MSDVKTNTLRFNAVTGANIKTTGLWFDGQQIIERRSENVEPLLEHCAGLRGIGHTGSSDFRLAAKLPKSAVEAYLAHHGITLHEFNTNPAHIKAMLNDPALSKFRIWQGRV